MFIQLVIGLKQATHVQFSGIFCSLQTQFLLPGLIRFVRIIFSIIGLSMARKLRLLSIVFELFIFQCVHCVFHVVASFQFHLKSKRELHAIVSKIL